MYEDTHVVLEKLNKPGGLLFVQGPRNVIFSLLILFDNIMRKLFYNEMYLIRDSDIR